MTPAERKKYIETLREELKVLCVDLPGPSEAIGFLLSELDRRDVALRFYAKIKKGLMLVEDPSQIYVCDLGSLAREALGNGRPIKPVATTLGCLYGSTGVRLIYG